MKPKHCKCKRCQYEWWSRVEKPKKCASCRSILWDNDYVYNVKSIQEKLEVKASKEVIFKVDHMSEKLLKKIGRMIAESEDNRHMPAIFKETYKTKK